MAAQLHRLELELGASPIVVVDSPTDAPVEPAGQDLIDQDPRGKRPRRDAETKVSVNFPDPEVSKTGGCEPISVKGEPSTGHGGSG